MNRQTKQTSKRPNGKKQRAKGKVQKAKRQIKSNSKKNKRLNPSTANQNSMNNIKRIMGIVWMLIAPAVIYFLVMGAIHNIGHGTKDINKPIPWFIIIGIFTPIAIGLMIFGWYAYKGEYDKLTESTEEI